MENSKKPKKTPSNQPMPNIERQHHWNRMKDAGIKLHLLCIV